MIYFFLMSKLLPDRFILERRHYKQMAQARQYIQRSTCCIKPFNLLLMLTLGETGPDGETGLKRVESGAEGEQWQTDKTV